MGKEWYRMQYNLTGSNNRETLLNDTYGKYVQFTFYTKSGRIKEFKGVLTYKIPSMYNGMLKVHTPLFLVDADLNEISLTDLCKRYVGCDVTTADSTNDKVKFLLRYANKSVEYMQKRTELCSIANDFGGEIYDVYKVASR